MSRSRILALSMLSVGWFACGDNSGAVLDAGVDPPDGSITAADAAAPDAGAADAAGGTDALPSTSVDATVDATVPVCGNGTREDGEQCDDGNQDEGDGCEGCQSVGIPPTAFRVTSLAVLDPHLMAEDAGCRKGDLTSFVNDLVAGTLTDLDGDMVLDFAPVMVFRPLQQGQPSGAADFVVARCTATSPVACTVGDTMPVAMDVTNRANATCMEPLAGTTGGYTPPVEPTPGPCFVTGERTLSLSLSAIQVTLIHAQIAATYSGNPATSTTNGVLRGFMTEETADATRIEILDASLSALLPGSSSNGCPSDVDIVEGVRGWWFYLAFTAEAVAWTDPPMP